MSADPTQASPAPTSRRRVVRGAFVAPALVTLHCTSAFAAASNLRCIGGGVAEPPAGVGTDTAGTTWVRAPLYKQGSNFYVKAAEVPRLAASLAGPVAFRLDPAKNYNLHATQTLPQNLNALQLQAQKVLVRVNADGLVVDFGGISGSSTGLAVTGSCWGSFA